MLFEPRWEVFEENTGLEDIWFMGLDRLQSDLTFIKQ